MASTGIRKKTASAKAAGTKKPPASKSESTLMVRLDQQSKQCLAQAASLRHISVSDYVRTITVPQAKREIAAASEQVIAMSAEEQLAFWNALNEIPVLTSRQRRLGAIMRGEA
jgi:uncharacterized protein (DUF1778 family)